jgi:TnpA family transposase
LGSIYRANIDLAKIEAHWEQIVHLVASVHSGHTSAIQVLARFGAAVRGDPLYEAFAQLGRLLRTAFLADYFINEAFRGELLRVLNQQLGGNFEPWYAMLRSVPQSDRLARVAPE